RPRPTPTPCSPPWSPPPWLPETTGCAGRGGDAATRPAPVPATTAGTPTDHEDHDLRLETNDPSCASSLTWPEGARLPEAPLRQAWMIVSATASTLRRMRS